MSCTSSRAQAPLPATGDLLSTAKLGSVPSGFSNWRQVFTEQAQLNTAADLIEAAPDANEHLAGIAADPTKHELQVYWKGDVPAAASRVLASIRQHTKIRLLPAPFSHSELLVAAQSIAPQPGVIGVGARWDGSGLYVMLGQHDIDTEATIRIQTEKVLASRTIAIDYSWGSSPGLVYSRDFDTSPYGSGARIYVVPSSGTMPEACSIGFAVQRDGVPLGWLTAGHCTNRTPSDSPTFVGRANGDTLDTDRGAQIGTIWQGDIDYNGGSNLDVAVITANDSNDVAGLMYTGGPRDSSYIPVAGAGTNHVGNYVFTSGSSTGLNGVLKITAVDVTLEVEPARRDQGRYSVGTIIPAITNRHLVRAEHVDQYGESDAVPVVGTGDSGGPVFSFNPDGRVLAMGIISARDTTLPVPCPSVTRSSQTICSSAVYYADIRRAFSRLNVSLTTAGW